MAKYRNIHVKLWKDPVVQKLSSDNKLLWIYLLTNEQLNESGVYILTPQTISNETGLTIEQGTKGLIEGLRGLVEYDTVSQVVWIINFFNYQHASTNMLKSVQNDIKYIKSPLMAKCVKHHNIIYLINNDPKLKPIPTLNPNPIPIPIESVSPLAPLESVSPLAPSNGSSEVKKDVDMSWIKPQ